MSESWTMRSPSNAAGSLGEQISVRVTRRRVRPSVAPQTSTPTRPIPTTQPARGRRIAANRYQTMRGSETTIQIQSIHRAQSMKVVVLSRSSRPVSAIAGSRESPISVHSRKRRRGTGAACRMRRRQQA